MAHALMLAVGLEAGRAASTCSAFRQPQPQPLLITESSRQRRRDYAEKRYSPRNLCVSAVN